MRSLIRDLFLSLVLLGIFGWAGYEFYRDLNGEIRNEGGEVIGEISYIENSAQRKFTKRAVWGELETSSPLYNYDSLRTIDDSRAVIRLIDGTEITMDANSYIVLEWGEESRNIEFLGGNISASSSDGSGGLQIRSEDTVIALNKASVSLNKTEGEEINLSVDQGTIDVSRGGRTTSIEENFKASISDDITVEQEAVKLKVPLNNRLIVTTSASVPISFTWDQVLPLTGARLEIGEYKDFINFSDYSLDGNSSSYDMDIIPGTYYWRISGEFADGSSYSSPSNRVVIIRDNAPQQQVPVPDESFEFRNTPPDLAFSWEASALANESVLQIAPDPGFTEITREISGPNNFSTLQGLTEGTWYWRVIPRYSSARLIAYSAPEIRRFNITRNDSLEPPRLILPAAGEAVNPLKVKDGLRFSWKADREIGSYHIVVAGDREMNAPIVDQWLSRNSYLMEDLPPEGEYFWMVEGLDRDNKAVPPSPLRGFSIMEAVFAISTVKPVPGSLNIVESFDNIPFSWESTVEGPYRVEIFRDGSVPLISQVFNGLASNMVLPGAGSYSWQVAALDDTGVPVITSIQTPFEMVYRLTTPRLIEPDEGDEISLLGSTPLTIEWQPVGGAQYYSAELIPRDPDYPTLTRETSAETTWTIADKALLRTGGYTLQVQAHQRLENGVINSSGSAILSFSLDQVQEYGAPRLLYPADGQRVTRQVLIENKPSFRWTQTPALPRQRIRLSRDPNFSSLILDEERSVLNRPVPDLETGVYYVQLSSEDNSGNSAPDSQISSFEVTPVPALPSVRSFSPLPEEILDMQTRDTLDFNWSDVPGTSYYRIALYSTDTGNMVFREDKWSGTNYNFRKLEDLDVGAFRFDVQAVRELDGRVFQESPVLNVPFQLTLPEIDDIPDILSPELQYAR